MRGSPSLPLGQFFSMGTIKRAPRGVVLVFVQHPSRAYWLSTECSLILLIDNSSQILTSLSPAKPVTTGLQGTLKSCSVTEQYSVGFVQQLNMFPLTDTCLCDTSAFVIYSYRSRFIFIVWNFL